MPEPRGVDAVGGVVAVPKVLLTGAGYTSAPASSSSSKVSNAEDAEEIQKSAEEQPWLFFCEF
jgi:hypothetical protein